MGFSGSGGHRLSKHFYSFLLLLLVLVSSILLLFHRGSICPLEPSSYPLRHRQESDDYLLENLGTTICSHVNSHWEKRYDRYHPGPAWPRRTSDLIDTRLWKDYTKNSDAETPQMPVDMVVRLG